MSIQANFPAIKPTLLLDFANTDALDPRITFTRASTGTYYDAFGVLLTAASGVPRFEHNPVTGESLGLEIEEQRTNLLTYSEQFDNAAWTKISTTITANTVVAPDGTNTADKLVNSIASVMHYLAQGTSIANVTCSVYAKAAELSVLQLAAGVNTEQYANFNLATGSVGSSGTSASNISMTSVGNGWYRCSVTWTAGTTGSGVFIASVPSASSLWLPSFMGNGFSGIYIWGAQLEAGAFPTSYIPTVASQVTRAADSAVMTGANFSSWYRQDEGTIYAKASSMLNDRIFWARDSSAGLYGTFISMSLITTGALNGQVRVDSVNQADINTANTVAALTSCQGAFAYKRNDFALLLNAGAVATDTNGIVPSTINQVQIGGHADGGYINGTIKKIAYYPVRVTNAQLQALTS